MSAFGKAKRENKDKSKDDLNVKVSAINWHFHDFKLKGSKSPSKSNVIKALKVPVKSPPKEKGMFTQHVAIFSEGVFTMGTIDSFISASKTALSKQIKEEVSAAAL